METLPTLTLSDGRVAAFTRKPKASDTSKAHRIAGAKGNNIDRNGALLAQIITIDGKPQTMESVLDLDLDDFNALVESLPGKYSGQTDEA